MSIFTTTRNLLGLYKEGKPAQQALPKKENKTQAKKNVEAFRRNLERGMKNLEEKEINEKQEILRQAESILKEMETFSNKPVERKEVKEVVKTQQLKKEIIEKEKIDEAEQKRQKAEQEISRYTEEFKRERNKALTSVVTDEIILMIKSYNDIRNTNDVLIDDALNTYRDVYEAYKTGNITDKGVSEAYIEIANNRLKAVIDNVITDDSMRNKAYDKLLRKVKVEKEEVNNAISRLSVNDIKDLSNACRLTNDEDIETIDEYGNIVSGNYYDNEYLNDEVFYNDSQYEDDYNEDYNNDFNNVNNDYSCDYSDYINDCDDANILEARLKLISKVDNKLSSTFSDDWSQRLADAVKYGGSAEVDDVCELENIW